MAAVPDHSMTIQHLPARRAWRWCLDGLGLWRRFPLRLFLLCLLPMVLEGALQWIPLAGMLLSKILPPLLGFGVLQGLAWSESSGALRWSSPFHLWRMGRFLPSLGLALICGPAVVAVQLVGVAALHGWPAVDAVLLGHAAAHRELMTRAFTCLLILPGIPVAILLGLAPMYLLFRDASPWLAIRCSVRTVWRWRAAFGLYASVQLVLVGCALVTPFGIVLVLPLLPWMTASSYAAWKDIDAVSLA